MITLARASIVWTHCPGPKRRAIEVDRATERQQVAGARSADRDRRPVGRDVDDGAAPGRRSPSTAARTRPRAPGAVPGSPRTSHSSGPSHRTWRVPSAEIAVVFGSVGRRAPRTDASRASSAASAGSARRSTWARNGSSRTRAGSSDALERRASAKAVGCASSRRGLPVASPVLRIEQHRFDDLGLDAIHRAAARSTRCADPVAAALDQRQREVRPRAALRYDDVTWPSIGTGGVPRSASGADQLGAFGKEHVGVDRQQADELLPVRPRGVRPRAASAGR